MSILSISGQMMLIRPRNVKKIWRYCSSCRLMCRLECIDIFYLAHFLLDFVKHLSLRDTTTAARILSLNGITHNMRHSCFKFYPNLDQFASMAQQ
jgi:hypothetical protein